MDQEDDFLDISSFNLSGTFDEQVKQLLGTVRLTKAEVENLHYLIEDVQNVLSRFSSWKGCRVHPFGSIVTGLGIRSSDIDCFVSLPGGPPQNKAVYRAKALLQSEPQTFTQLEAIAKAKVPIVKCFHIPTERQCDINFTSMNGVQNSRLLAYLLHVDPRALPLAILIKYWSKVHQLTGTNLVPNYALTLMVIFFLQTRNIVPPVYTLQTGQVFYVDNWNTAFEEIHFNDNVSNVEKLYDLLGGFFLYYRDFDFHNLVISPYLGRAIPKIMFEGIHNLPHEFELYRHNLLLSLCRPIRTNTSMCVQDPYDHSRNCSVAVHPKLFLRLMRHIVHAAKCYCQRDSRRYLTQILTGDKNEEVDRNPPNMERWTARDNPPNKIMKRTQMQQTQTNFKKKGFLLMFNEYRNRTK